jgi:hypothetical protein
VLSSSRLSLNLFFQCFGMDGAKLSPVILLNSSSPDYQRKYGNDNFYDETGKGWDHSFKLGPLKSALGNLPDDESRFPVSTWLKSFLANGLQQIVLNSLLIRKASPPGQIRGFKPDGSNLPWVISDLEKKEPHKLKQWIEHLQTALPDLRGIRTVERSDDRHRYMP